MKGSKVFISYSWDDEDHRVWVRELATRLRQNGVDVTLDQWHIAPGDQLSEFMERAVNQNDFILIICTPRYKERSDSRIGGVGYEGDIMTAAVLTTRNNRKFIPILRVGEMEHAAPTWILGKYYIDLSSDPYTEKSYQDLLSTLIGQRPQAPPLGEIEHAINKDNSEITQIIVSRPKTGRMDMEMALDVYCDGSLEGFLEYAGNVKFKVTPGIHTIYVSYWMDAEISMTVSSNDIGMLFEKGTYTFLCRYVGSWFRSTNPELTLIASSKDV